MTGKSIILFIILFSGIFSHHLLAQNDDKTVQTIIHLLDYTARDYPAAIQNGKIINQNEYTEMMEFSLKAYQSAETMIWPDNKKSLVLSYLTDLQKLISRKAGQTEVAALANKTRAEIIEATGYKTAPMEWPDLKKGKKLYEQNCTFCHGAKGNGKEKLAKGLSPSPTNFLNDTLMSAVSPFQAYNTIKLGVGGTAMRGFTELTDDEVWELAFYIKSLRFERQSTDSTSINQLFDQAKDKVALKDVAILSDRELLAHLGKSTDVDAQLKALRTYSPLTDDLPQSTLDKAINYLKSDASKFV